MTVTTLGVRLWLLKKRIALVESCGGHLAASNAGPDWVYNHISKDVTLLVDRIDGVLFDSQPVSDNVLEGLAGLGARQQLPHRHDQARHRARRR